MAYQALYRKWRPLTFDEVVGQKHITRTIKNEIISGHLGHAFLFCGTRGTGKTSTARIFSRAINCLDNQDGNPCNQCENCRGILDGSIMDIEEIDAASHSGVDDIREIREKANYAAAALRYKVYIIDEAHNLSSGAFNALLKMLEEPPEHVRFVLATTEAHKIMETIASRCQRFDFRRIRPDEIAARVAKICESEGIEIDGGALRLIAAAADGSLRDALSFLETCLAGGKKADAATVADILGSADNSLALALCEAIGKSDAAGAMAVINEVSLRGKMLGAFFETVLKAMRDMLIINVASSKDCSDFFDDDLARLEAAAGLYSPEKLLYSVKTLSEALSDARFVSSPRVVYEAAVIRQCFLKEDDSTAALLARMGELEKKLARLCESGAAAPPAEKKPPKEKKARENPKEDPKPPLAEDERESGAKAEAIIDMWPEIMRELEKRGSIQAYAVLSNSSVRQDGGKVAITFPDNGGRELKAMLGPSMDLVTSVIREKTNSNTEVVLRLESDFDASPQAEAVDPLARIAGLPYVDIEE